MFVMAMDKVGEVKQEFIFADDTFVVRVRAGGRESGEVEVYFDKKRKKSRWK